jgi:hypothetical protein
MVNMAIHSPPQAAAPSLPKKFYPSATDISDYSHLI